jgi:hypothetical protein
MAIHAIALLQLTGLPASADRADRGLRINPLDDALLLRLDEDFSREPEALSRIVRALVGEALDRQHRDPRGILFIPDVAVPKARSYDAVIEEVGEGGVWGPLPKDLPLAAAGAGSMDGLGALLGNMLGQLPTSVLESAQAAAQGDPGAFQAVSSQLQNLMGNNSELQGMAGQLAQALEKTAPPSAAEEASGVAGINALLQSAGLDPASSNIQQLLANVQSALQRDPTELARLAEQLFEGRGGGAQHDHEDDDEDA